MNQPLLDAVALRCERGGRLLFDDLSLSVAAGESLQIGGVNGSGKTSLLRILAGLLPADAGTVRRPAAGELLWLGHAPGIAEGLADRADHPCRHPSAGQRRRVALARLQLPAPPRLWLLDEPFTALDASTCARLEARLQAHCAAGGALVLTSHRELEAAPAAHRLLWLDAGR